ncbi:MAG TPA: ABC transporter permease, partial [Vicinamibacteria bacterium]|nr:ABC transporter permease [Vicinamibacteria bacterium]
SLVTGLAPEALREVAAGTPVPDEGMVLNDWAARALQAKPGDTVELAYYLWREEGDIETKTARFEVSAIVPLAGPADDRDLTPSYPGITDSLHLSDWDPPFPVDLDKVEPRDEEYWRDHRTTPKAFVPLERAQRLWGHRLGRVSAVRVRTPAGVPLEEARRDFEKALRGRLDPARFGLSLEAVRADGLAAATGSTDFGEYFVYFSFFLVVSALLLAALFFRLGVEQRLGEVGLLEAVGFSEAQIRRLFLREGVALAAAGSLAGALVATGYARLVILGLGTIWRDAVGTDQLTLHVRLMPLVAAALAGLATAALVIATSLRALRRLSPRALLTGAAYGEPRARGGSRRASVTAVLAGAMAALLVLGSAAGLVPTEGAFFGAGALFLAAGLALAWRWLTRQAPSAQLGLVGLGLRSAAHRPGRSLLCVALVAAAAFMIVSVGAFQHGDVDVTDPRSGAGGYTLEAESLLPVPYALDTPEGRDRLNLTDDAAALDGVRVTRLRLKPGDDASCLNLYRPRSPRVLGAPPDFVASGRFRFAAALPERPEEKANPWLTLERRFPDGAIPVIADQNSLTYVLKKKLGDDVTVDFGRGPVRLRFVAALAASLFQRELIIHEREFLRLFPEESGYRFFLIEAPAARADAITTLLESRLADQGFDVASTAERLAAFFEVENTYLATFQALGGLGLLLGTVGLGAVLLRNALERRRELALVRAVGFRRDQLRIVVLAENLWLLGAGIALGAASALVAVAPAALQRGGELPLALLGGLLLAVAMAGLLASALAVEVVTRTPLVPALKAE